MKNTTKILRSFCFIFVMIPFLACAEEISTSASCLATDLEASSLSHLEAQPQQENLNLLLKMDDLKNQLPHFQQALAAAHSLAPDLESFRISQVSHNIISLIISAKSPAKAVIEAFIQQGKILYAETNHKTFLTDLGEESATVNQVTDQTGDQALELPQMAATGKEIIVAVIDSGVDYTHKDLVRYMWRNPGEIAGNGIDDDRNGYVDDYFGHDFANNDSDPMADDKRSYHGTHVAGIVKTAAQLGRIGINLKIMALKYLDSTGTGWTGNAIKAIDYAVKNGAIIINNSWGSLNSSRSLVEAIERARLAHVLFIAAAGNGDSAGNGINIDRKPFFPAAYKHSNIISVAAANDRNILTQWSNFGGTNVDIAAPGLRINSTVNGNRYALLSGTSMASPFVAGVAAMLWNQRPDLSYKEIRYILFKSSQSAQFLKGKVATSGGINPDNAMALARNYRHDPNDKDLPEFMDSQGCYQ